MTDRGVSTMAGALGPGGGIDHRRREPITGSSPGTIGWR